MKRISRSLSAPVVCAFLQIVLGGQALPALSFWDNTPPNVLAQQLVRAMTDEQLAAQVFLLGYPGVTPPPVYLSRIETYGLGGVKIFGWNAPDTQTVAQAVDLVQKAASVSPFHIPLFVATDQEGGWVRHIKGNTSTTSGSLSLGAEGLAYDAYHTGNYLAHELAVMGVNMNFAPSVDLYINPDAHVIGPRSFSADPYEAGWLATAFVRGEMDAGVIPTAKHFPGHGNTSQDSHGGLPIIQDTWQTLKNREMIPYKMLIKEGLPAIMTGHLAFPQISGNLLPASLNPRLNRDLLRKKLGFQGVVITDDLFMVGAKPADWSETEPAIRALMAGNDLLLLSQPDNLEVADFWAVVAKMRAEPSFKETVQQAVSRDLLLKLKFLKSPLAPPLYPNPTHLALPDTAANQFFFSQAVRSVVLLKKDGLPWSPAAGKGLLVITPYGEFYDAVKQHFPDAVKLEYNYHFFGYNDAFRDEVVQKAPLASRILLLLATPGAYEYLKVLEPWKDKVTVVSVLSPAPLRKYPWVKTAIAAFGTDLDAFDAAVAVLDGQLHPTAKLPLHFSGLPDGGP